MGARVTLGGLTQDEPSIRPTDERRLSLFVQVFFFHRHVYSPAQLVSDFYPRQPSGQAVVTGVFPYPPQGTCLHLMLRMWIPCPRTNTPRLEKMSKLLRPSSHRFLEGSRKLLSLRTEEEVQARTLCLGREKWDHDPPTVLTTNLTHRFQHSHFSPFLGWSICIAFRRLTLSRFSACPFIRKCDIRTWSQVSSLIPPAGTCLQLMLRIGFSIPVFHPFQAGRFAASHFAKSRSRVFRHVDV